MNNIRTLSYWGGKGKPNIRDWIQKHLPYSDKHVYIEPFVGMCNILLTRPKSRLEIINDIDTDIMTWWKVIRDHHDELRYYIDYTPHCRRTFKIAYDGIRDNAFCDDPIKCAWAVYMILQHGITHSMRRNAFAPVYQGSLKLWNTRFSPYLDMLHDRVCNVQMENTDALVILKGTRDVKNAMIYCDPPYHGTNAVTGEKTTVDKYQSPEIDIDAMSDVMQRHKGKIAISGYEGSWDHLGWNCHTLDISFVIGGGGTTEKEGKPRTEYLYTNYSSDQLTLM